MGVVQAFEAEIYTFRCFIVFNILFHFCYLIVYFRDEEGRKIS